MKRVIFILVSLMLYISSSSAAYIGDGNYLVRYRYINYAVSPVIGNKRYLVLFKNRQPIQILDLKRAKFIEPTKAFGLKEVKDALTKNYKKPNNCTIYVDLIKKVSNNFKINPYTQREKELNQNYTKWIKKQIKSYTIRIQDSRLSQKYKEGVELTVKNGKIIKARDVRSYQYIDPNNKYFLTVPKLFGVAKWGLKDAILDYDSNYGYPSYIKLNNGITIYAYYLKIQ